MITARSDADVSARSAESALRHMRKIPSVTIGELVMKKLKMVDEVAYVRFASVYREFKDVNAFMDELAKFLNNK